MGSPADQANNHLSRLPIEVWTCILESAAEETEAQRHAFADADNVRNVAFSSLIPPSHDVVLEELDSQTCFPYAAATTCRLFRNLLIDIPSAWRRIRVFLDAEDPAGILKTYIARLQRKKKLSPTDILITRSNWKLLASSRMRYGVQPDGDDGIDLDMDERRKVQEIIEILLSQMSGATSLTVQTLSGDSLPSILHFSFLDCPYLHTLVLDSIVHGSGSVIPISDTLRLPHMPPLLPVVRNLALTGPNFVTLLRSPEWEEWFETSVDGMNQDSYPRFNRLRISHYRDSDGIATSDDDEFTLEDFFGYFFLGCQTVGELVDISCGASDVDPASLFTPTYEMLTMERVSSPVIDAYMELAPSFFNIVDDGQHWDVTHIFVGCDISSLNVSDPPLEKIITRDSMVISHIFNPNTLKRYLDFAADDVYGLWISECPGFDDSVVNHLISETAGGRRPIPNLRALYINNCPQVSIRALQDVVSELNKYGCMEVDEESNGLVDSERSSDFEAMLDRFYDETFHNDDLVCPKLSDSISKQKDYQVADYSDWGRRMPDAVEDDDLEDGDYCPTEPDDSQSVYSDLSDGDRDSVELGIGPQIRMIQFSGASPKITQENIEWFEKRGVVLEVV